jgi:hypothetical protein
MIQAHFTLRGFKELFNDPAGPYHPHQRFQRPVLGGEDDIGLQLLGVLTLRRTSNQRRQAGCTASARGSHRQSYQRGPFAPSPALSRVQPSTGKPANSVVTRRCRQPSQTYSLPETAST